ncbi:hypothetical protein KI387_027584, partial [Taxus chinensis]
RSMGYVRNVGASNRPKKLPEDKRTRGDPKGRKWKKSPSFVITRFGTSGPKVRVGTRIGQFGACQVHVQA